MTASDLTAVPTDAELDTLAQRFVSAVRTPLVRNPSHSGLAFDDVSFPSADGTPLEAWFIPRAGSNKLVVMAHPLMFNRYGLAAHLDPWRSAFGPGNDFELNLIPNYRILHDNGYNVLTFDFRNYGLSGAANGGLQSAARFEARDVLGALNYVRYRPDLASMTTAIFAACMGAAATFRAVTIEPRAFEGMSCLVAPLLLSARAVLLRELANAGISPDYADEVDRRQWLKTSVWLAEASPADWAPDVRLPTLTYGVRDDLRVPPEDLESIFAAIGAEQKELFWIHGTSRRWDGYLHFQRHPDRVLRWLDEHMT